MVTGNEKPWVYSSAKRESPDISAQGHTWWYIQPDTLVGESGSNVKLAAVV